MTCVYSSSAYMFTYFCCLFYAYDMISLLQHLVLYIIIVRVLLLYLLLPPSFYHSLVRSLTTLGLHAQIGDPRYRFVRESIGVTSEIPHRGYS